MSGLNNKYLFLIYLEVGVSGQGANMVKTGESPLLGLQKAVISGPTDFKLL